MLVAVIAVVAGALACARLTRLVVADQLTAPARTAIARRFGPSSRLAYLANCRWCTSMWLAPLAVAAAIACAPALQLPWPQRLLLAALLAGAYSHTTGLLARAEGDD